MVPVVIRFTSTQHGPDRRGSESEQQSNEECSVMGSNPQPESLYMGKNTKRPSFARDK
jgi:hypothetical protein